MEFDSGVGPTCYLIKPPKVYTSSSTQGPTVVLSFFRVLNLSELERYRVLNHTLINIFRALSKVESLRGILQKKHSIFKDSVQIGGREVNPIFKKM